MCYVRMGIYIESMKTLRMISLFEEFYTNGTNLHSIYLLGWKGEEVVTGEQECIHYKEKTEQVNVSVMAEKLRFLTRRISSKYLMQNKTSN